jgi:hypothetical protein
VSFAATALYVASQRMFIVVSVYFVIDSVRKRLDTPWYKEISNVVIYMIKNIKSARFSSLECILKKRGGGGRSVEWMHVAQVIEASCRLL